jgi:Mg2+ and Co2+ transporter CorA
MAYTPEQQQLISGLRAEIDLRMDDTQRRLNQRLDEADAQIQILKETLEAMASQIQEVAKKTDTTSTAFHIYQTSMGIHMPVLYSLIIAFIILLAGTVCTIVPHLSWHDVPLGK